LLIFLTPQIVSQPTDLAAMNPKETQNLEIAPKAFSEKDLNKFLDGVPIRKPDPKNPGQQ
jgi:hypothetical protein